MPEIAAILTFPTLWAAASWVSLKIAFWGDQNPAHPGKLGAGLLAILLAAPFALAGSVLIYVNL